MFAGCRRFKAPDMQTHYLVLQMPGNAEDATPGRGERLPLLFPDVIVCIDPAVMKILG